ncbi:MAG: glycosyltransferase family 2 protein [Chloroflexi bacterium]|nr:MAG: glycosyltransferase family 2 protein [Chloroflexota bacterium]
MSANVLKTMLSAKVTVVLINWNRIDDTLDCIESLHKSDYLDIQIVVVDNGSIDDSLSRLHTIQDKITIIASPDNMGFTGGNNLGMRHAAANGSDYVLLLNNDTTVAPNMISALVAAAEAHKGAGIISPKIFYYDHPRLIWHAGGLWNARLGIAKSIGHDEIDRGQYDQSREVSWASGCALLLRRTVIQDVGFLCDDFFAVAEDVDYCLRVQAAGYKVLYVPEARVWHKVSASSGGGDSPQYIYYQTRNLFMLQTKWIKNKPTFLLARGRLLVHYLIRVAKFMGRGQIRANIGIMLGIYDGIRGKTGKQEYQILLR